MTHYMRPIAVYFIINKNLIYASCVFVFPFIELVSVFTIDLWVWFGGLIHTPAMCVCGVCIFSPCLKSFL